MTPEEVKKFWQGVEETTAIVDTWPSWKWTAKKDDPDPMFKDWKTCFGCGYKVKKPFNINDFLYCSECRAGAQAKYIKDLEAHIQRLEVLRGYAEDV